MWEITCVMRKQTHIGYYRNLMVAQKATTETYWYFEPPCRNVVHTVQPCRFILRRFGQLWPRCPSPASDNCHNNTPANISTTHSCNKYKEKSVLTKRYLLSPQMHEGCCLLVLQLGPDYTAACENVPLSGVTVLSHLSLNRHASIVSASCFHWLRQLPHSWCSLDTK